MGCVWALIQFYVITTIPLKSNGDSATTSLTGASKGDTSERLIEIYTAIYEGADSFLKAEYTICAYFTIGFGIVVFLASAAGADWDYTQGGLTATAFVLGAFTSMLSGYLGMKVAVYSNVRTTISAQKAGWTACFNTAFRAGAVMGFALCGLGMIVLYIALVAFKGTYSTDWGRMTECITGYGLGGSCIAMFGRVGGGIYTKVRRRTDERMNG